MASSSSSSHFAPASSSLTCKYDVFLSFRGEDTRKTFVDHLYSTLYRHLISVYKDDLRLPRGESIDQSLFEAIEESRIAIVIFSKNYADSSWCLEELAHIMKCKDEKKLIVIPIFYDVEPTDVRNQTGKFGEAFVKQESKNVTKADLWRNTLIDVSNIAGWELKNISDGHESQFIKKVVDTVLNRLISLNSYVDEDLVGMEARFQDLRSLLDIGSEDVRIVGIWGIGGGGKTTIATSFYMKISQYFQSHCIIENVREETNKYGLKNLQENILLALFDRKVQVHSVVLGKQMMKHMLCGKKVLVLLDDVDKLDQLEALAGKHNWFGNGSRIIITTRDEHLLRTHRVDYVYPIKLLSNVEALRLFSRHAYNEKDPIEDYETLSLRAVSYASGLPLSLKVLGSFLYDKHKKEWESALNKLLDIPDPQVINILKISYDGLEPYQKELFLDIACLWRQHSLYDAMEILKACGFHPEIGIKVLRQKALINIIDNEIGVYFDMHDLVQEMAHYIVRHEHSKNPEKHSRVWKHEEIKDMCFKDSVATKENETIEAIKYVHDGSLHLCKLVSNMKKLRCLIVSTKGSQDEDEGPNFLSNELQYIHWYNYPARSPFPDTFLATKLVVLKLSFSMQKQLWKGNKHLPLLKVLGLFEMKKLLSLPDFSGLPCLQKLMLGCCTELEEIHQSLENHTSLEYLRVSHCQKLKMLPTISQMQNIKALLITWCYLKDGEIPSHIGKLSNLQELNLSGNSFSRLDFSLSQLTQLKTLNLSWCNKLLELPELPSTLAILTTHSCESLSFVRDFTINCNHLCQVSLKDGDGWSDQLLQSMLKGKAIENGSMYFQFEGLEIAKGFTPPLFRGSSYRLKLPKNWCNDFCGFLMCIVFSSYVSAFLPSARLSMKHVSGMDSEDDAVWEESVGDTHTFLCYVSFDSLKNTTWWDQRYNVVAFSINNHVYNEDSYSGFGVRLVNKKNTSGVTETSTNSSRYTPKIHIQHDSAFALTVTLKPYDAIDNILIE